MSAVPSADDVEHRKSGLGAWRIGSQEAVADLAAVLGAPDPAAYVLHPTELVAKLQSDFRSADLSAWEPDLHAWWWSHLVAHVAAVLFSTRGSGDWLVDTDPASPSYGRYVVGGFTGAPGVLVDVGELVQEFLQTPPPRAYVALLAAAEEPLGPEAAADA